VFRASGTGPGQRFTFQVSDAGGRTIIADIAVLFAPTVNTTNACFILYDSVANTLSVSYKSGGGHHGIRRSVRPARRRTASAL